MGLSTLPPLKAVRVPRILVQQHHQHQKKKGRTSGRHHYLLRMRKEESLRMRRLGSGLLEHDVLDSEILTHLVSLLDSQRGAPFFLGDGSPRGETGASGRASERSSLFSKRSSLALPDITSLTGRRTSRDTWTSSEGRELPGEAPRTSAIGHDALSTDTSSEGSLPHLPPISSRPQPLSPIKDVSREASLQLPSALPVLPKEGQKEGGTPSVQVMPATPQHSTLPDLPTLPGIHHPLHDPEACLSEASGYNLSSDSSVAADPALIFGQRSSNIRPSKSKGSKRRQGAKAHDRSSMESPSLRGSMVMAPDGEIVQVGGAITPRQHDVGVLRDVTSQLRHYDGGMLTDDSGMSDEEGKEWNRGGKGRKPKSISNRTHKATAAAVKKRLHKGDSSVTEEEIVDTLTQQAKQIADAVLEKHGAGTDLERDITEAADLWMETHPAREVPCPQAVQDALKSETLEELMAAYRDSSGDPTAAEYRHLIQQSLTIAVAKAAGLNPEQIPQDLEISAELLEALANQKLSPDDISIVYDAETGRPMMTSRQEMTAQEPSVGEGGHPTISSNHLDVDGTAVEDSLTINGAIHSEGLDSVENGAKIGSEYGQTEDGDKGGLQTTLLGDVVTDVKRADKPAHFSRDAFASGGVDLKADLFTNMAAAPESEGKSKKSKKEGKKKGRRGKRGRKEEESGADSEGDSTPPPSVAKVKDAALTSSDDPLSPSGSPSPDRAQKSSEEELNNDDDSHPKKKNIPEKSTSSPEKPVEPLPFPEDEDDDEEEYDGEERSQANREARAARRAAAAAKRKEEVERRRKEREEQAKLSKGEMERQEQLRREMEMERLRREEERRLRKLQEEEEADREEREREEERRRKMEEEERERREREEHQRRLDEMKREHMEEEARRNALLLEQEREEERKRAAEELMLSQMAEQERLEYERRKREEEEARRKQEEHDRLQREEEAQRAVAEARRLAEEAACKQAALEAKLRFNRSLRKEARSLGHSHDVSRPFVFSYFQLVRWLGLDPPEFDSFGRMKRYY